MPSLTGRVVDGADILTPEVEARLNAKLAAHEKSTGQQFAVLTVKSLKGESIEGFSIRVVEAWKLGAKEKDDGLLLLVVPDDRKVRIEVGYGLEGDVTDAISARIIRNVVAPAFRNGDYAGGIEGALNALMVAASGKVPNIVEQPRQVRKDRTSPILFFIMLFMGLGPFVLGRLFGRRGRRFGGGFYTGGFYGGGGGYSGGGGFGGGFSGGGGGFGGGGASGSW